MLEILPCHNIDAVVQLPGSKYIANRLIPMCVLAESSSVLTNIVDNDDIQTAIKGLKALGYQLDFQDGTLRIEPRQSSLKNDVSIHTAHSGTFSRFISSVAALESASVFIDCSDKMATRPMKEIFSALSQLGANICSENNRLPATINGPITGNKCLLESGQSSQYLSSLMIVGPKLSNGLEIEVDGNLVSSSYIEMTKYWMSRLGVEVLQTENRFQIACEQVYQGVNLSVPGDAVSASYFMGLAAIAKGQITINAFDHDSAQGEAKFYNVLEQMGMRFVKGENKITAICDDQLKGIEIDMGEMPDVVQTLAVIACFASGETIIKNIAHLAFKESNRIVDTANELRKTGIHVEHGDDYLMIRGGKPSSASIQTYDDHRMAMSMALLGVKTPGIIINNENVVSKSFPTYWKMMSQCGLKSQ